MATEREDLEPWYRQFWPWFIISLLGFSVIASLSTVWISLQTTDSLVLKSDDGIQIVAERRISAERLANELNLAALLAIDLDTGAVSAAMRAGVLDEAPAVLELEFTHPAFANRDQLITLHRAQPDAEGNPIWSGHFVEVPDGRWYVTLRSGDEWRLSGEWQGQASLTMRPANAENDERR
jgi:hypothetical protein